jgi:predicted acyltransferase
MKTDITSAQKICGQVSHSFLSYCTNADHIFSWYLFYSELNH